MTMTIKELVLEILYSKPVHFSRTNRIREDRVNEWIEQFLLILYDTIFPSSQCALSHACPSKGQLYHAYIYYEEQTLNEKIFY